MQKAATGGVRNPAEVRNDGLGSIASSFDALIAHVKAAIEVIETAIECESACKNQPDIDGIFVLDDVMPRYAKARAELHACDASLNAALTFLREDTTPTRSCRAVRLVAHA
jgi:hypothetical protein